MKTLDENPLVTRIRALAQHELAHFVTAIALGFEGYEVTLKIHMTELVHRGKSRANNAIRCETLEDMRIFMHKRAIVTLAGVMGESVSRSTFKVDMRKALDLLELEETGAALDNAVAKELAQLIDNSSSEVGECGLPAKGSGSLKVFQEIFIQAASVVHLNVRSICVLADLLAARAAIDETNGFIEASLTLKDIEHMAVFREIQHVSLAELFD